jgi:nitrite reductase/ring-hydroxylating ferredoxin subunit
VSDPFGQVHDYVEALLAGRRPKRFRVGRQEDWRALQFAAGLTGERDEAAAAPAPEFLARLQAQLAVETVSMAAPRATRRGLLAAALAALATGAGGFLAGRLSTPTPDPVPQTQVAPPSQPAMVRDNGQWFGVAKLSQLKQKQVVRFTAGAVEGHLVRSGNKVHALSAICSHLPCSLTYRWGSDDFLCPCHDVSFDMHGEAVNGRRPYDPLTPIQVKIEGDNVMVWSIGEAPKPQPGVVQPPAAG